MQLKHDEKDKYILIMHKGEKVMETFKKAFEEIQKNDSSINGAFVSGTIGALENSILSYRNNDTQKYQHQTFKESMEIVSLSGNLSFKPKEQFFAHIHVGLSGDDFIQYGGHLTSATVSITMEALITVTKTKLTRQKDSETGLDLIKL